ncbi:NUDIX hydrolase [Halorientalis brevis]|uniref:NUDIX hydrolase n=1 Tax=Halorientalis brevis TaxID=1126241 RepID=A0ABD6C748_9EURY|nr:NUDIX hydrolase [Halorientalis brevis]
MTEGTGDATGRDETDGGDAEPLAWETLYGETAYMCPGFDIQRERVRLPDGTETDYDYLSESESVVIVPFTPDGEVVLIEEWRQAVKRVNRGFPAGGVEASDADDLATTARRELEEETGYEAEAVDHLTTVEPANGIADAVFHYFVAEGCEPTGEQDLDHNESIRVTTADFADLEAAVRDDELRDGRTALGVLYYAAFGE